MYIIQNPATGLYYKGWGKKKWTKRRKDALPHYYRSSAEFIVEDYLKNEQLEIIDLNEL